MFNITYLKLVSALTGCFYTLFGLVRFIACRTTAGAFVFLTDSVPVAKPNRMNNIAWPQICRQISHVLFDKKM